MVGVEFGSRRFWIVNRRCHHGMVGAGLVALGVAQRDLLLVLAGAYLMYHDRADWPWHPARRVDDIRLAR